MAAVDDESKATENSTTPQKSTSGSTEFEPPMACIRRMLKTSLPANTNVGKDACSAFSRACGIFIVYLTACANDFARESKRQTITANDILAAVKVGLEHVVFFIPVEMHA
jgi:histone H3/H4